MVYLGQMVEAGVSPEGLGKGAHAGQLDVRDLLGPVLHGAGEPGFQGLHTTPQSERGGPCRLLKLRQMGLKEYK